MFTKGNLLPLEYNNYRNIATSLLSLLGNLI